MTATAGEDNLFEMGNVLKSLLREKGKDLYVMASSDNVLRRSNVGSDVFHAVVIRDCLGRWRTGEVYGKWSKVTNGGDQVWQLSSIQEVANAK